MEVLDVLQRIPAIADAMERTSPANLENPRPPAATRPWTLMAREPGQQQPGVVQLRDYAQGRVMALELSEIGFMVTVCDAEQRVRLSIWPPH